MTNQFGIPEKEEQKIRARDKKCVYCNKKMIHPVNPKNKKDSASIEHLNCNPPFYCKDGLQIEDIAICCGSCNSSRGAKKLLDWFKTKYCLDRNINENAVSNPVKEYLNRKKK